jgi:hypothetical protein
MESSMSTKIKFMILAIVDAALEVNRLGQLHVFVDLMAHVEAVEVRIISAGTDYHSKEYEVTSGTAYYGPGHHSYLPAKEREPAALKRLQECLDLILSHASQLERSA